MKKVQRLNKLHKLLKIQEQDVLIEFKELQNLNHQIKMQINDLVNHSNKTKNDLMQNSVDISQLALVRNFNQKIEVVIEEMHRRLSDNNKNFLIVADKVKQLRTSLSSIEKLKDKHQSIDSYIQDRGIQKQIEENINFTVSFKD